MRTHSVLFSYPSLDRLSSLEAGLSRRLRRRFLLPILSVLVLFCPSLAGVASAGRQHMDDQRTGGRIRSRRWPSILRPRPRSTPARLAAASSRAPTAGRSWTAVNTGLNTTFVSRPWSLILQPQPRSMPGLVLVWCLETPAASSRAPTAAESWTAINAGLTSDMACPMSLPWPSILLRRPRSTPARMAGGVFKSTDGGGQLERHQHRPASEYLLIVSALVIDPSAPATLYAGTGYDWNSARRRRLQEHQRRRELERHQRRPDRRRQCLCPGHRSFRAGHALRRHAEAASSRAPTAGGAGRPSTPA